MKTIDTKILLGDCKDVLKSIEENSIDLYQIAFKDTIKVSF
jgi:DNA modification methylase